MYQNWITTCQMREEDRLDTKWKEEQRFAATVFKIKKLNPKRAIKPQNTGSLSISFPSLRQDSADRTKLPSNTCCQMSTVPFKADYLSIILHVIGMVIYCSSLGCFWSSQKQFGRARMSWKKKATVPLVWWLWTCLHHMTDLTVHGRQHPSE